jgi:hypothetical protein
MSQGCPPVKMAIVNVHTTENVNVALCSSFLCHGVTCVQRKVSPLRCEPQRTCQEHGAHLLQGRTVRELRPKMAGCRCRPLAASFGLAGVCGFAGGGAHCMAVTSSQPPSDPIARFFFVEASYVQCATSFPTKLLVDIFRAVPSKLANSNCQHSVSTQRKLESSDETDQSQPSHHRPTSRSVLGLDEASDGRAQKLGRQALMHGHRHRSTLQYRPKGMPRE